MKIRVKYYGVIRDVTRERTAEFELPGDATVSDLLGEMHRRYGQEFAERVLDPQIGIQTYVRIFLNREEVDGRAIKATRLTTGGLSAEAAIYVLPGSTGG